VPAPRLIRGLLALNVAFLIRASRFGFKDAYKRLKITYSTMSPFGTAEEGLEPERLIKCIVENYCKGHGLEIGPGSNPSCDPDHTVFLDKFPSKEAWFKIDIISDATSIPVSDSSFDYVFSSHCLEHVPDTIGTLKEWLRILRPGGRLVLVLPHSGRTWESLRTLSSLEHHIRDHENKAELYDFTDWDDFEQALSQTLARSPDEGAWFNNPLARMPDGSINPRWTVEQGFFHYHAWNQDILSDVLRYLGLNIQVCVEDVPERTDSFLIVASKPLDEASTQARQPEQVNVTAGA
jgi:SAM-dependent methyltransferase